MRVYTPHTHNIPFKNEKQMFAINKPLKSVKSILYNQIYIKLPKFFSMQGKLYLSNRDLHVL